MTIVSSTTTRSGHITPRLLVCGVLLLATAGCPSTAEDPDPSDTDAATTGMSATSTASTSTSTSTASSTTTASTTASSTSGDSATSPTTPSSTADPSGEDSTMDASTSLSSSGQGESDSSGCGDTAADPMNCGECGNVCAGAAHGAATCESGSCAIECDGGYDAVGVGNETRCSMFAGFFLLRETQACEAPNPFTGDCSCPQGFDDRPVTSWRVEPTDGSSWVQLAVCSPVAGTPEDSWGGLYAEYDATGSCAFPNPFNIPFCGCAAGYSVASEWLGSNINGDAMRVSFCSAEPFEDDALFVGGFTEACNGGCAAGASCSCPPGSTQVDYPTVVGGCATSSAFCYQG